MNRLRSLHDRYQIMQISDGDFAKVIYTYTGWARMLSSTHALQKSLKGLAGPVATHKYFINKSIRNQVTMMDELKWGQNIHSCYMFC